MFIATIMQPDTQNDYDITPPDKPFVIGEYDQLSQDEHGDMIACQGFVLTCKNFLNNLSNCLIAQPDGIYFLGDGTYK